MAPRCRGCAVGALLVLACLVPAAAAQAPEEAVTVRVANHDWPPFLFGDDREHPQGLIRDLLEACLPATGLAHEYHFYPINRVFAYLEEGKLDVNVMSRTPARELFAQYGREPLFTSSYRPVVRASSTVTIESLADLDPLKLGHLAGLRYTPEVLAYVERRVAAGPAVTAPTQESLIQMLLAGRVDVFVIPVESLAWRARQMGVARQVRALPFEVRRSEYFVTVSRRSERIKDRQGFLDAVDACLEAARQDGRHAAVLAKYGLE
jgi:ABC-type amino acid transport substrate-binding protein